ncbi:zinc ribbon domain-containing protein [Clostridium tyrobutyricum]|uniref:zinc ribbon domain-containing protein n=1 Tax=Clostridium tyrobutyricum TaxID=1519 RepID=UPI001C381517|nr:zinc ribbon domain-containing protein [Clostridium tyrobutyricum]MBV4416538.1 zinc ribbon domain-containing protein [Clostridium tyrobutyricum]
MNKLRPCKICGKEIAKSAKVCPNCGARQGMGVIKKIAIIFCILVIVVIIISIFGNSVDNSNSTSSSQSEKTTSISSNSQDGWDKTEEYIDKNDNMNYAVSLVKKDNDLKSKAISVDSSAVAKAPFKYYGQVVRFAGQISDIEEYASGTDWSKNLGGGAAGQIVIASDDGTVIDMFVVGSTGDLKKGDYVTLYGYPIGLTDNANSIGGKDTELAIVGNSFEKADDSTD